MRGSNSNLRTRILGKSVNDAKKEYDSILSLYKEECESIDNDFIKLYEARTKSVELIQKTYDCLNQNNSNTVTKKSVEIALSYTKDFRNVMELDIKGELPRMGDESENREHYSAALLTGLRTQRASLSLAASLGSVCAISTALYSTLALEVSAASLIAGPIGFISIGIVSAFAFLQKKKINAVVKKLEDGTNEIRAKLKIVKSEHYKLILLINKTLEMNNNLQDRLNCVEKNCSEKETTRIADTCKLLGKIMNETIETQH